MCLGFENTIAIDNSNQFNGSILLGVGNVAMPYKNHVILGIYNSSTPSLTKPNVVIGCGISAGNPKNAIEINTDTTKILTNLQLKTDTTEVNAITPPQDPNNVTQDDMTLVTKSYMSPYLKEQELTAQADTAFSSNSPTITLPTPPSWCRLLQITARVGGRQTTVIAHYDPTPGVPHTVFSVDCLLWNDNSEVFEHNWCEFEYDNTTNSITWTNYVQWTHDLPLGVPGTTTLLKKGIANCDTTVYPVNLKSVIAIA